MTPMSHEEAQRFLAEWVQILAAGRYELWTGLESDGPVVIVKVKDDPVRVLQWLLK